MKTKESRLDQVKESLTDPRFIMTLGFVIADLDLAAKVIGQAAATGRANELHQGISETMEKIDQGAVRGIVPDKYAQTLALQEYRDLLQHEGARDYFGHRIFDVLDGSFMGIDFSDRTSLKDITEVLQSDRSITGDNLRSNAESLGVDSIGLLLALIWTILIWAKTKPDHADKSKRESNTENSKEKNITIAGLINELESQDEEEIPPWAQDYPRQDSL